MTSLRKPYIGATAIAVVSALLVSTVPAAKAAETSLYFADAASVPAATTAIDAWWLAFGDAQLDTVIARALDGSPDLTAASGRLTRAQAYVSKSQASRYPSATFLGGGLGLGGDAPLDTIGLAGLNFGYELDFWGKNRAAIQAASSAAEAAEADLAQARLALSTSIASAWIDLDRLYAERDLAQRAVALKKENLDLVSSKRTQGLISDAEVQLASAGWYNAQGELSALDEMIGLTRNRIAALAGANPDFGATLGRPALHLPQAISLPERIDLNLIGRRPDIAAARWRAEAAHAQVKGAHAAFYPNINLMAFVGRIALGSPIDLGQTASSLGPAITLPIFDGGSRKASLRASEGDRTAAIAAYDAAVVNAMHEAADVVTSQRALSDRLDQSQQALTASESAYTLIKSRYDGGLTDYATLLLAEQTLIGQRRATADLQSRALMLDVALIKALGGSTTPYNP